MSVFRSSVAAAAGVLALVFTAGAARAGCQMQQIGEYHIAMDGNQPLVDATINGHPVRFIVDLGDWVTTLDKTDARRLGLQTRSLPTTEVMMFGVGGSAGVEMAHIDDFALGPIDQKGIDMMVSANHRFSPLAVGLLGQELLTHGDVEFDFAHGVMRLILPVGCQGDDVVYWANAYSAASLLDSRKGQPVEVNVQLNGHTFIAQMDTGASTSVVTRDAAERAGVNPGAGVDAQKMGGIGQAFEDSSVVTFSTFSVGGEVINNAPLRVADLYAHDTYQGVGSHIAQKLEGQADMLLGADFFLSHRVYIARSQGKVYFTYNGGPVFQVAKPRLDGELDLMIKDDDQAIALNPTNADAFEERGQAYEAKGDADRSIADYDRAVALAPDKGGYHNSACWARAMARRELDKALADCNAAVALTARTPRGPSDALDSRGLVWFRMGQFDKAIADYDAALKGNAKLASSLFMRGVIERRKGDTAGGDADIAAAKALDAGVADTYAKAGVTP